MTSERSGETLLDRMVRALEKVRQRLLVATAAFERAGVPYAVFGGNAVAAWVARVDEAAARNTQDVDILSRRGDLPRASRALQAAGFVNRHLAGLEMFLDGEDGKERDAVHVLFAGEKVCEEYLLPAPDVEPAELAPPFRMLPLDALVQMKLTSFRRKDQVHILDLIGVGLIDASCCPRLPPVLADRLRELLADPEA